MLNLLAQQATRVVAAYLYVVAQCYMFGTGARGCEAYVYVVRLVALLGNGIVWSWRAGVDCVM